MRKATVERITAETKITLTLTLAPDGKGVYDIETGIGFLNHMLELMTRHGRFDLRLRCDGDLAVDGHHTAEDIGIALGEAFKQTLGEKRGVNRFADLHQPMDEALVLVALDLSGRCFLDCRLELSSARVGGLDTQLVEELLHGLCRALGLTLHVRQLAGTNDHHIIEALFKGLGRALAHACARDPALGDEIPSTKGTL